MQDAEYEGSVKSNLSKYLSGEISIFDLNERLVDASWDNDHHHQAYAIFIRGVIHSSDFDEEQVAKVSRQSFAQIKVAEPEGTIAPIHRSRRANIEQESE